jgi:hypothetical protein
MFYTFKDQIPVPCDDHDEWVNFMSRKDMIQIALTTLPPFTISTIFMGVDHSMLDIGEPILFESVISHQDAGLQISTMQRYSTWIDAVAGHEAIVSEVKERLALSETLSEEILQAFKSKT